MGQKSEGSGKGDVDKHEKARNMAEGALDQYAHGSKKAGDKLLDEADKVDHDAVVEVQQELEEDSGADPDAAKKADPGKGTGPG